MGVWGKLELEGNGNSRMCHAEASLALPLVTSHNYMVRHILDVKYISNCILNSVVK